MEGYNTTTSTTLAAILSTFNTSYLSTSSTTLYKNLTSNITKDKDDVFWFPGKHSPYSFGAAIVISLVLLCIIIGTIVGNILVCVAVCLVRKLRRPCNYLLVSLAVSDICVAILVMPMATLYEIVGFWGLGPVMCNLWVSFDVLSCTASILNLCMISVDRYYAITKPLEYGVKRTPKRMLFCIAVVWLGAACISLPPLLILGNTHEYTNGETKSSECIVCQNFAYQIYATLGSFYIPLTVMIIVYYKIFRAARRIVLEERQARSHLETHCYLEISKNGSGPPEAKVAQSTVSTAVSTPAVAGKVQHHRPSTSSTNTTCTRETNTTTRPEIQLSDDKDIRNHVKRSTRRRHTNKTRSVIARHRRIYTQLTKDGKASFTLGIILSAFIFCWLPFFVLALIRLSYKPPPFLSSLFLWLGYTNSLLNPIIYATLNRDFRKPFKEILLFRCGSLNEVMRREHYDSQYGDLGRRKKRMNVDPTIQEMTETMM